jgi:hypothetical protein
MIHRIYGPRPQILMVELILLGHQELLIIVRILDSQLIESLREMGKHQQFDRIGNGHLNRLSYCRVLMLDSILLEVVAERTLMYHDISLPGNLPKSRL